MRESCSMLNYGEMIEVYSKQLLMFDKQNHIM